MKPKQIFIVLPYIYPPSSAIELHKARIIKMTEKEYFDAARNFLMYSTTPVEMKRIALAREGRIVPKDHAEVFKHKILESGEDIGNFEWAVLEINVEASSPSPDCYIAMFELLSGNWLNVLDDPDFTKQSPLVLVPMPRTPQRITLYRFGADDEIMLRNWSILLSRSRRLQIGLRSWWSSIMRREESADILVNCSQALEALFDINLELRLCLSLYTYHYLGGNDKSVLANIFEMYGLRSSIVHGSKIVEIDDTKVYIEIVGRVLEKVLRSNELPSSDELNKLIGIK